MEEEGSIFKKIQEVFGSLPDNYNILEEQIDVKLQMEYFEFSRKVKKELSEKEIPANTDILFDKDSDTEDKKRELVILASEEQVESYRLIERFLGEVEDEVLKNWAILAFQESRMLLQSQLLDENQVFISTGLGGKDGKLRYFVVLVKTGDTPFDDIQKKITRNEFEAVLKSHEVEIEGFNFYRNYATISALIPINISLKGIFKEAIDASNEFGDFLKTNFIITNVKKLSEEEIKQFMEKDKKSKD